MTHYTKGSNQRLSENFRAWEFDCNGAGCCTETPIDEKLVNYLQAIRSHFGKPVQITSGYRCPVHNAKTPNAAPKSKHMLGMAADIYISGTAPAEIAKFAESIGVKGIGLYDTFVHIDTREEKYFWYSHAQHYRATFGGKPVEEYSYEQFVRDVQSACGAKVDGIAGPETLSKTPTVSAYKNPTHPVIAPIQKRLYQLGYQEVGEADGIAGPKFTAAVKAYQRSFGGIADGEVTSGRATWKKLLSKGENA